MSMGVGAQKFYSFIFYNLFFSSFVILVHAFDRCTVSYKRPVRAAILLFVIKTNILLIEPHRKNGELGGAGWFDIMTEAKITISFSL